MSKNYYISDLHFSHKGVLRFDARPFFTVEEMNAELIRRWNLQIHRDDHVFILGDFCWGKKEEWLDILKQLKGNKHLIKGIHDLIQYDRELKNQLVEITDYKEITDYIDGQAKKVILCHYPILFYKNNYNINTYMLHGHVHKGLEYPYLTKFIKELKNNGFPCNLYNVGCMMPYMDYTPKTLKDIILYKGV